MIKNRVFIWFIVWMAMLPGLYQCRAVRDIQQAPAPLPEGMEGLVLRCSQTDTIRSLLISKAEAVLTFDEERYEVTLTLYSVKDSILFLSAVNNGYEIIRASVDRDSIKVISRLDKIVYRSPLNRQFGYQYPVNFQDIQNIVTPYYLCDDMIFGREDPSGEVLFDFDTNLIRKRILLDRKSLGMKLFDFQHQRTGKYFRGERVGEGFVFYSNFMITEFELRTGGGTVSYNRDVAVRMDVNPKRYTFTDLR